MEIWGHSGVWRFTLVIKHDVFRFEVSVNNPVGMQVAEGQRDLSQIETAHREKSLEIMN